MNDLELIYEKYSQLRGNNNLLDEIVLSRNNYIIPSWITNSYKTTYTISEYNSMIESLGLSNQILYDLVVLGLKSPSERPRCRCGKELPFICVSMGYRKYCSRACKYKYLPVSENFIKSGRKTGIPMSEETKRKISNSEKGKFVSEETREKLRINAKLGKNRTGHHNSLEMREKQRQAALRRIMSNPGTALNNLNSNRKIGYYKPNKSINPIKYLSSWELDFMKMCDSSNDIVQIDTVESIPYVFDSKSKVYIPDFKIVLSTRLIVIVEIKPYKLINFPKIIAKRIAGKKYCYNNGYKYITLTENELYKRINGSFNIFDYVI